MSTATAPTPDAPPAPAPGPAAQWITEAQTAFAADPAGPPLQCPGVRFVGVADGAPHFEIVTFAEWFAFRPVAVGGELRPPALRGWVVRVHGLRLRCHRHEALVEFVPPPEETP